MNLPEPGDDATFFPQLPWPKGSDTVGPAPERVKRKLRGTAAQIRHDRDPGPSTHGTIPVTAELQPGDREHADPPREVREQELTVAREIAESVLTATSPLEVYRTALGRVTPIVGASFASVFLRDEDDPQLLRLACAHDWPQKSARYLGDMRIREGRGPTGRAVSLGRPVEVEDVFANRTLREWWEPAKELGFVSMISLPLVVEGEVLGALSFYFRERQSFDSSERALLGVVAHQLAATAHRASRTARPGSNELRLHSGDEELMDRIAEVEAALERARSAAREERVSLPRPGPVEESS